MDEKTVKLLVAHALSARSQAYAPYSGFAVGAALLSASGEIFTGCNVENASYPASNCAERTAIFRAVACGQRQFSAIAIAGGKKDAPSTLCPPCGVCRQVLREFCSESFPIILAQSEAVFQLCTLGQLLPLSFGPENLPQKEETP